MNDSSNQQSVNRQSLTRQTKHKPRYDYICVECGNVVERDFREATFIDRCDSDECAGFTAMFKRVYAAPFVKPMMHEHFNNAVGQPVSDMNQFKNLLKQKSDEASEHVGMEHKYQALEYGDHQAFGATGEGVYESNVTRSKIGAPLLGEIKGEV